MNYSVAIIIMMAIFAALMLIFTEYIFSIIKKEDPLLWMEIGMPSVNSYENSQNGKIYVFWRIVFLGSAIKNKKLKKLIFMLKYMTILYIALFLLIIFIEGF